MKSHPFTAVFLPRFKLMTANDEFQIQNHIKVSWEATAGDRWRPLNISKVLMSTDFILKSTNNPLWRFILREWKKWTKWFRSSGLTTYYGPAISYTPILTVDDVMRFFPKFIAIYFNAYFFVIVFKHQIRVNSCQRLFDVVHYRIGRAQTIWCTREWECAGTIIIQFIAKVWSMVNFTENYSLYYCWFKFETAKVWSENVIANRPSDRLWAYSGNSLGKYNVSPFSSLSWSSSLYKYKNSIALSFNCGWTFSTYHSKDLQFKFSLSFNLSDISP